MKKLLIAIILFVAILAYVSFYKAPSKAKDTPICVLSLKERVDTARMITYVDSTYNVGLCYPSFFVIVDTEPGTARFRYPSDSVNEIALTMFVEPNVEGWNIKDAVEHLTDSNCTCAKQGDDYYMMSGMFSDNPLALFYEKCFLIDGKWVNLTLYYLAEYETAIGRLIDSVKCWNPKPLMLDKKNKEIEMDSTKVSLTTLGLDIKTDLRYGYKNCSVKMPNIKGLQVTSRWAYCKKDSCNSGYYVIGMKCPPVRTLRRWTNDKLWEEMKDKDKGYYKKAPKTIVDNPASSATKISDFYINQWLRHYNHDLNSFLKCEGAGKLAFPTEQFGLIITDVWHKKNYYTMCVHQWYDMMSNGCPYTTSYYTIDASTGKELSLNSLVSKNDYPKLEDLLKRKLAWMKKQRDAFPLQDIDFLSNCTGVALVKEGLLVYYHPYTIGAGFEDQYNVIFPYSQLKKEGITIKI